MSRFLSPIEVVATHKVRNASTVGVAIATFATLPNRDDFNGALYAADFFLRVDTTDGGTTPTLALTLTTVEDGDTIAYIVPLMSELGVLTTAGAAAITANKAFHGRVFFRADKNSAVRLTRTAGGTPSNDGVFDIDIVVYRIG